MASDTSPGAVRRHGTLTMATYCHCEACRAAHTRYRKFWVHARSRGHRFTVPAAPTHRKIQALSRLGWTFADIAYHAGFAGPAAIRNLLDQEIIRSTTEVRFEETYRLLEMQVPVMNRWRARAQNRAISEGWLAPLAYDDIQEGIVAEVDRETASVPRDRFDLHEVEHMLQHGVWDHPLSPLEKAEVVRRWTSWGRTKASLCDLTGWRPGRYS